MSWELVDRLRARFPEVEPFPRPGSDAEGEAEGGHKQKGPAFLTPGAFVPAERLLGICRALRDEEPFLLDYCSFVSAVDRPEAEQFEVAYHLYSTAANHELLIKARVDRNAPSVPSVSEVWSGALWHERETFDLFGVTFVGHPDLRRIMMTDDWIGHPLRKDYVFQEPQWMKDLAEARRREAGEAQAE